MKIIRKNIIPKVQASHEDPADPGVFKQVLLRRDYLAPGRIGMINWSTLLPGRSFRSHYHEDMDEIFIILDGNVEIFAGNRKEKLRKGDTVVIPHGIVHSMKNLTKHEVSYITIGIVGDSVGKTIIV